MYLTPVMFLETFLDGVCDLTVYIILVLGVALMF